MNDVKRPQLEVAPTREMFVIMCEGNVGALQVLMELAKQPEGLLRILDLDDMNMRGSQIWVAWKDHCKQDMPTFLKALQDRDLAMVETVNNSLGHKPGTPQAVICGGSWRE